MIIKAPLLLAVVLLIILAGLGIALFMKFPSSLSSSSNNNLNSIMSFAPSIATTTTTLSSDEQDDSNLFHHHHYYYYYEKDCTSHNDIFFDRNHKLIFFGDSNTIGQSLVSRLGWHHLGSHAKYILQSRRRNLRSIMMMKVKEVMKKRGNNDRGSSSPSSSFVSSIIDEEESPIERVERTGNDNDNNNNVDPLNPVIEKYVAPGYTEFIKLKNFTAPTTIFGRGSTGLSGIGGMVRFQTSEQFRYLYPRWALNYSTEVMNKIMKQQKQQHRDKKNIVTPPPLPVTVFIMFGSNDSGKWNSEKSTKVEYMRKKYKSFIFKEIFKPLLLASSGVTTINKKNKTNNNDNKDHNKNQTNQEDEANKTVIKIKRIFIMTPPRVFSNCSEKLGMCKIFDIPLLENRIVPMIRNIVAEYNNNDNNKNNEKVNTNKNKKKNTNLENLKETSTTDDEKSKEDDELVMMREIEKSHHSNGLKLHLIDVYAAMTREMERNNGDEASIRKYFQMDGLHLSPKGYQLIAKLILDATLKQKKKCQ